MKIGKPYHPDTWNCATCVADYYDHELPRDEWSKAMLYWIHRNFRRIDNPITGDLVLCYYTTHGGLHAGIHTGQGVYHAYRVPRTNGGTTVITAHSMFHRNFKKIRYYRWLS